MTFVEVQRNSDGVRWNCVGPSSGSELSLKLANLFLGKSHRKLFELVEAFLGNYGLFDENFDNSNGSWLFES